MEKPFAFISYAHDHYDSQIVRNVFNKLYEKGYNLWIDIANIPKDENSWEYAAQLALIEENCKLALFFRSEESLIRQTIKDELRFIKLRENISRIVTTDIWHDKNNTAKKFLQNLTMTVTKENIDELDTAKEICSIISVDINAYRMCDIDNELDNLVAEFEKELKKEEIYPHQSPSENVYVYEIFGKEYRSEGQAELMYNAFSDISDKYPDKINDIIKMCTSVEYAENISNPNTRKASPIYFIGAKSFTVNDRTVVVGSNYGLERKIIQISKMLQACGENFEQFKIISKPDKAVVTV